MSIFKKVAKFLVILISGVILIGVGWFILLEESGGLTASVMMDGDLRAPLWSVFGGLMIFGGVWVLLLRLDWSIFKPLLTAIRSSPQKSGTVAVFCVPFVLLVMFLAVFGGFLYGSFLAGIEGIEKFFTALRRKRALNKG